MQRTSITAIALAFVFVACSDDTGFLFPVGDGGLPVADVGGGDAGTTDAGATDTGSTADVPPGTDGGHPGADSGVDTGRPAPDAGTDTSVPTSPLVDPDCIDGRYAESLPPAGADISALISGYSSEGYREWILDILDARYPIGAYLVRGGLEQRDIGDCIDLFVGDRSSARGLISQIGTVVHECGHFFDIGRGGFSEDTYVVTDTLAISCRGGDTTDRGGETFARSLINGDDRAALRRPCGGGWGSGCDSYADIYLDGDPFDGTFDGGDQGFNSLVEEAYQYVNSLATGYALNDQMSGGSVSERDGILTFLWWLERYLRYARVEFPDAHAYIIGDACWREAILTLWGRAWIYLEATASMDSLEIDGDAILALVEEPELLQEIERVREAEGCR